MDVLQKSARFRAFVEALQVEDAEGNTSSRVEIEKIVKDYFKEIEDLTGLTARQLTQLVNAIDISPIDENNYAAILDMLEYFSFDQKNLIIKDLSRRCRMQGETYDIELLTYNEETGQGNNTLKALIQNTTCICEPRKCPNNRVALSRFTSTNELKQPLEHHYFCYRQPVWEELAELIKDKQGSKVDAMVQLEIIGIEDIIDVDIAFAFKKDKDYVYEWIANNPNETEKIKKAIAVPEFKLTVPPNVPLLRTLVANGYTLTDNNKAFLRGYMEEYPSEANSIRKDLLGETEEYIFRPVGYEAELRRQMGLRQG